MRKRLLLDTQAFILASQENGLLPRKAQEAFLDEANDLYLSVASLWEAQIKILLGKLRLPVPLEKAVRLGATENGIRILPVEPEHVFALASLPDHHRDPFDRLLIAQALCEKLIMVTGDAIFSRYRVTRIW